MHPDLDIFNLVNGFAGNWMLDRIAGYEEANNLLKGGLFMAAFWYFWFKPGADRDLRRKTITSVLIGALAALVANRAIASLAPFRLRPMYEAGIGYVAPSVPIAFNLEQWNAFPSDTATWFFALSIGIAALSRPLGLAFGVYSALYICLPRVYLGVHYPSDLAIGALLGLAIVPLVNNRFVRHHVAAKINAYERKSPGAFYSVMFLVTFEMAALFDHVRDAGRGIVRMLRHYGMSLSEEIALPLLGFAVMVLGAAALRLIFGRRRMRMQSVEQHGP